MLKQDALIIIFLISLSINLVVIARVVIQLLINKYNSYKEKRSRYKCIICRSENWIKSGTHERRCIDCGTTVSSEQIL